MFLVVLKRNRNTLKRQTGGGLKVSVNCLIFEKRVSRSCNRERHDVRVWFS